MAVFNNLLKSLKSKNFLINYLSIFLIISILNQNSFSEPKSKQSLSTTKKLFTKKTVGGIELIVNNKSDVVLKLKRTININNSRILIQNPGTFKISRAFKSSDIEDSIPPELSISEPLDKSSVNKNGFKISGNAKDNAELSFILVIVNSKIFIKKLSGNDKDFSYLLKLSPNVSVGKTIKISAILFDTSLNVSKVTTLNVKVGNQSTSNSPTPTLSVPVNTPTINTPIPPSKTPVSALPLKAIAPYPVFTKIDALKNESKSGMTEVWGDYWETSTYPLGNVYEPQTKELSSIAQDGKAIFADLDLGLGVNSFAFRISGSSSKGKIEVKTAGGTLLGSCNLIDSVYPKYDTIICPLDPALAKGTQSITISFLNAQDVRFNWFSFWAEGTTRNVPSNLKILTKSDLPPQSAILSTSYGMWSPQMGYDCPKWLHDTYWTTGPDQKVYSTWHPAVDFNPDTGMLCTYGHEHGDNPKTYKAFDKTGMPPFGYVNEQMIQEHRHEDHVGHKVTVFNDFVFYQDYDVSKKVICDAMVKIHMGTHSPDALTNTAHENFQDFVCDNGINYHIKGLISFGTPGKFTEPQLNAPGCNREVNPGVAPSPLNQPNGGTKRAIPSQTCYDMVINSGDGDRVGEKSQEAWIGSLQASFSDNTDKLHIFTDSNNYFHVNDPSRYYHPSTSNKIKYLADSCYDQSHPIYKIDACKETRTGSTIQIKRDDPRALFRGAIRAIEIENLHVYNNTSYEKFYTNAYRDKSSLKPSLQDGINIEQTMSVTNGLSIPNGKYFSLEAPKGNSPLSPLTDYSEGGTNGVRSPN